MVTEGGLFLADEGFAVRARGGVKMWLWMRWWLWLLQARRCGQVCVCEESTTRCVCVCGERGTAGTLRESATQGFSGLDTAGGGAAPWEARQKWRANGESKRAGGLWVVGSLGRWSFARMMHNDGLPDAGGCMYVQDRGRQREMDNRCIDGDEMGQASGRVERERQTTKGAGKGPFRAIRAHTRGLDGQTASTARRRRDGFGL